MTRLLVHYFAERTRPGLFVPVLAGLWVAAFWASGAERLRTEHLRSVLLIALLVLQFRLWDDIEDVDRDRQEHPRRVLTRSHLGPFRRLLAVLAALALVLGSAMGGAVVLGVAALDLWFVFAYRFVRRHVPDVVWRFPVLLAKYPAFVLLGALATGGAPGWRVALAMAATMTAACAYEAMHHTGHPTGVVS